MDEQEKGMSDAADQEIEAREINPSQRPDPEEVEEEIEEEEFSLDTLSQVYAQVLKQNRPFDETSDSAGDGSGPATAVSSAGSTARTPAVDDTVETHAAATVETAPEDENELIDAEDNACCPISPESIVEAMLFVGAPIDVKLTPEKLAEQLRDVSPKEVSAIVEVLNERYEKEGAVYRIRFDEGHLFMELENSLRSFQRAIIGKDRPAQLSSAAIEVLAIVAYNQPISKSQVEELRKKPSGALLNQLTNRGLLTTAVEEMAAMESQAEQNRGSAGAGRVKKFLTTDRFLELMNLDSIDELPQSHEVDDLDQMLRN